ncbi:MAG: Gx transporter family protein [Clostridia bacterium]|nr:Gx transporter family protein [Clostridia bacterium]
MDKFLSKKITLTAIFACLSAIAFTIENLLPPFFIPGARLGLSNVFILLCALLVGKNNGYFVLIIKILIGSIVTGNYLAIIYSLPAGLISYTVEIIVFFNVKKISIIAVSVLGSVINICLQNVVFCLVTKTFEFLIYMPYLIILGTLSGTLIGFIVFLAIKSLKKRNNLETQN